MAGENVRDYSRKFRDLAELAFPTEQRTGDQVRNLIRYFVKGLNSAEAARSVLKTCPTSLAEAMTAALDSAEMEETQRPNNKPTATDVKTARKTNYQDGSYGGTHSPGRSIPQVSP